MVNTATSSLAAQNLKAVGKAALLTPYAYVTSLQVLTAILRESQLPGAAYTSRDSTACVPAGAAYRMDENITVFAVRILASSCNFVS
jgi:hypothetical protein